MSADGQGGAPPAYLVWGSAYRGEGVAPPSLVVTPLRRVRGRLALADLVAAIPPDAASTEVPWGDPEGREV